MMKHGFQASNFWNGRQGGTPGNTKVEVLGGMEKQPLCRRIVCRRTCQASTMMIFPGRRWNKLADLKVLKRADATRS
eukprot:1870138-Amphidinium_carterae.1